MFEGGAGQYSRCFAAVSRQRGKHDVSNSGVDLQFLCMLTAAIPGITSIGGRVVPWKRAS